MPPLKPLPMKDRMSMIFVGRGQIDVRDGAFVVVDEVNGEHMHIPVWTLPALGGMNHAERDRARDRDLRRAGDVLYRAVLKRAGGDDRELFLATLHNVDDERAKKPARR